jgi:hypothetical protein
MRRDGWTRPEAVLLLWMLGAYAFFFQAGGWNANVRFALVRSVVEQGRLTIDDFRGASGDLAKLHGSYYCDKAPGISFLSVPLYAAQRAVLGSAPSSRPALHLALYLATVLVVGLPAALAVVVLYHLARHLTTSPRARLLLALAYGLATPAFPYATLYYGHQLLAALLLLAFALLVEMRSDGRAPTSGALALVGLVLGLGVAVEYPGGLAVAVLGLYAVSFVRPWARLSWIAVGLAPPTLLLALYHTLAFGHPWVVAYQYSTQGNRRAGFFMGIAWPDTRALYDLLLSDYRGLLYSAPWLILAVPGALALWRRGWRREVAVCAAVSLGFLWMNASLVDWQGGWTFGARYLVPALPFLAVLAAGTLRWLEVRRAVAALALGAVVYSTVMMLIATAVRPEVDMRYKRPFAHYLFAAFSEGRLATNPLPVDARAVPPEAPPQAWNLGQCLGLEGLVSLAPLGLWLVGGGLVWRRSARAHEQQTPR